MLNSTPSNQTRDRWRERIKRESAFHSYRELKSSEIDLPERSPNQIAQAGPASTIAFASSPLGAFKTAKKPGSFPTL